MPSMETVAASIPVDRVPDVKLRAQIKEMMLNYRFPPYVASYIAGRILAGDAEGLRCWNREALEAIGLQMAEQRHAGPVDKRVYARCYAEELKKDLESLAQSVEREA
jgi:hypothetical protein